MAAGIRQASRRKGRDSSHTRATESVAWLPSSNSSATTPSTRPNVFDQGDAPPFQAISSAQSRGALSDEKNFYSPTYEGRIPKRLQQTSAAFFPISRLAPTLFQALKTDVESLATPYASDPILPAHARPPTAFRANSCGIRRSRQQAAATVREDFGTRRASTPFCLARRPFSASIPSTDGDDFTATRSIRFFSADVVTLRAQWPASKKRTSSSLIP